MKDLKPFAYELKQYFMCEVVTTLGLFLYVGLVVAMAITQHIVVFGLAVLVMACVIFMSVYKFILAWRLWKTEVD